MTILPLQRNPFASVLLACIVCLMQFACGESPRVNRDTAKSFFEAYLDALRATPIVNGSAPTERENYSTNVAYAKKSAALIQGSLGGDLAFKEFHHLPFELVVPDRKIEANLFVFRFENEDSLKKYLKSIPAEMLGKRGMLTAKPPQRFEAFAFKSNLIVLVIDGAKFDRVDDELFSRLRQLIENSSK